MRPTEPNTPTPEDRIPYRPVGLRPARADGAWMRIIPLIGILLVLVAVVWVHVRVERDLSLAAEAAAALSAPETEALVDRMEAYGGPAGDGAVRWYSELRTGRTTSSDLLLRVFTGTDYLVSNQNDRAFARDSYDALIGQEPPEAWLDKAEVFFANGGSRVSLLGVLPGIPAIDKPEGSVRTFMVTAGFPRIDSVTIGVATAEGQCRLDGVEARVGLYVDGRLRSGAAIASTDQAFEVAWDTRLETPGTHEVVVLLRSSDGRGRIIEQGTFLIPRVENALDGSVIRTRLVGHEQWFVLTPATRDVLFNANDPSGDIAAQLFSLDGDPLLACDNRGQSHETLRLRGDNDQTYYARVRRGAGQTDLTAVDYTITVSEESARIPETGEILAVRTVDETRGSLTAADVSGAVQAYELDAVERIEYTARLSALELRMPDGSQAAVYPAFSRDVTEYGLYLPAGSVPDTAAGIALFAEAQEGGAASLQIINHLENGIAEAVGPSSVVVPARSENRLAIRVTGYDGSSRTYTVYILYSPHTGAYDTATLQSFPTGYRSGLWLMHVKNPAYVFEPFDTGIAWQEFIDVQDETNRSLIQSSHVPASWVEPDSPVYDGTAWKAALRPVIEHYADPRNFLSTDELFQFETMDWRPDVHSIEGVRAILKGSFMEPDLDTYADIFMRAGAAAGISPYFLASRALQEMGVDGESQLAHGTLAGYEGYYNYFNIGSYPNPSVENGQRINGALFAMYGNDPEEKEISPDEAAVMIPWDTAEKSILGGAVFIANRYVNAGQNTLYFQKFDVIPEDGLYTRQYAQNIQMAWAEGLRYYTAYREIGLASSPFVFRIPFYRDMPDTPVQLPAR